MNKSVGGRPPILAGPLSDCRNLIATEWATTRLLIASHKAWLATSLAKGLPAARQRETYRAAKICQYCSTARVPKGNSASKTASVAVVSVPTAKNFPSDFL